MNINVLKLSWSVSAIIFLNIKINERKNMNDNINNGNI